MTTKTNDKGVEEIQALIVARAKKGSCKTCEFCEALELQERWGEATEQCLIQGNVNPIFFSPKTLNSKAYPCRCEEGALSENTQICYAYMPRTKETDPGKRWMKANAHREFMGTFQDAARINFAIRAGHLGIKVAELNATLREGG